MMNGQKQQQKILTVILPIVRLPVLAGWYPRAAVTMLRGDGDDPAEQAFPSKPIESRGSYVYGKIDFKVIRAINLCYDRSGMYDADALEEIWRNVAISDTKIKRINIKALKFYWTVYGRKVELHWARLTAHPKLFVPESSGGAKPGMKLVQVLRKIKDEMVESGKIPEEEVHEYKSSVLMLVNAIHFPIERGEWWQPDNIREIQSSLGDTARMMDIIDTTGKLTELVESSS